MIFPPEYLFGIIPSAILILFIVYIPSSAWTRIKSKFNKAGVLVTLCYDDGFEKDRLMKADLESGIFYDKKNTIIFTPNPVFIEEEIEGKKIESMDIPTADKKSIMDEAILKRTFTDTGKAHYICLVNKGIAVTSALLGLINDVNEHAKSDNIYQGSLVTPQILKSYFKGTFSGSTLKNIEFAAEQRGYMRRPVQDFIKKNAIPLGFILIIVVFGYLYFSGKIHIPNILDKFGG
jgi:hypothetical protein